MQILGVDLGTTYVKTSNERIFSSGISENILLGNTVMEFEGKKYAMEITNDKSISDININKSLNKNLKLNFIYALFLEGMGEDVYYKNVTVGLPCSQWKNDKTVENFKKLISFNDVIQVTVNGVKKYIYVENVDIAPEGYFAYYTSEMNYRRFKNEKVLLLDWGGLTLNQLLFQNNDLIDMHTDEFGVLKVYKSMAEAITTQTGIDVKIEEMFDVISNNLFYKNEIIDISKIIEPIGLDISAKVYKDLKLKWHVDTIKHVPMVGAGSITMEKYLKQYVPHCELIENAQFLFAKGSVGDLIEL